jgi:hypothetical protein
MPEKGQWHRQVGLRHTYLAHASKQLAHGSKQLAHANQICTRQ